MSKDTTTAAPITEDERRKRQRAVNYARASVGLEAFKPSQAEEEYAARFVAGEIDFAEFVKPGLESVLRGDRFKTWPAPL